jgi:NAD(P)-dependent dehydrogenase (short-subunit alcohol dehydrogenase family)
MNGRVCLVTGANAGVGKAIASGLARQGSTVVMLCRDQTRGAAAQAEIRAATGNQAVELLLVDLASQESIRRGVQEFKAKHDRLDVLVNGAALVKNTRVLTADGLETMFATNHLGAFLLTNLLMDALKASDDARIINLTAPSTVGLNFEDLQGEKSFNALNAFGATKMCNLLFTYELARRLAGTNLTVNAVHPGIVKTGLMREANPLAHLFINLFGRSPEKAAEPIIYLASSPEVRGMTGKFFKDRKVIESNAYSLDRDVQQRLWDVSLTLAKVA